MPRRTSARKCCARPPRKPETVVGDGTSTSTVLAHAIFADGVRNVAAGASAIDLKRGLDRAFEAAAASLKQQAGSSAAARRRHRSPPSPAHNDAAIGELVADAMEKVGSDGVITVEESKTIETALEVVEGLQFDRGFLSPYFVTDSGNMEAVLESAYVFTTDRKLDDPEGPAAASGTPREERPGHPVHRRGHRERGAGHADPQSDSRLC